jgi:5'-3' exonuclease
MDNLSSSVSTNKNTLVKNEPVMLVDTSYWLYHRFFALRNWYHRAYPDKVKEPNFNNADYDWFNDEIFITKYKKLFIENLKQICKKFNIIIKNIVFCIDCSHKNIWRLHHNTEYKGTRQESHKKNKFNSFNIFQYIKTDFLVKEQNKYGYKILQHYRSEADDIIGLLAPYLVRNNWEKVYILANDNDYLQICCDNITLLDGHGKILNKTTQQGEKYLISKILLGDISDNIKYCLINCGFIETGCLNSKYKAVYKSYLERLLNDTDKYEMLRQILYYNRGVEILSNSQLCFNIVINFKENQILMDFQMIPNDIKIDLEILFNQLI